MKSATCFPGPLQAADQRHFELQLVTRFILFAEVSLVQPAAHQQELGLLVDWLGQVFPDMGDEREAFAAGILEGGHLNRDHAPPAYELRMCDRGIRWRGLGEKHHGFALTTEAALACAWDDYTDTTIPPGFMVLTRDRDDVLLPLELAHRLDADGVTSMWIIHGPGFSGAGRQTYQRSEAAARRACWVGYFLQATLARSLAELRREDLVLADVASLMLDDALAVRFKERGIFETLVTWAGCLAAAAEMFVPEPEALEPEQLDGIVYQCAVALAGSAPQTRQEYLRQRAASRAAPRSTAVLRVFKGDDLVQQLAAPVTPKIVKIGHLRACDVWLLSARVCRVHAFIESSGESWRVVAVGYEATFLNGERFPDACAGDDSVRAASARVGDVLEIGEFRIVFNRGVPTSEAS